MESPHHSDAAPAVLPPAGRAAGIALGLLMLAFGAVAVFVTNNELGAASLILGGAGVSALTVLADRISAFEAAGVRMELLRRAQDIQSEAEQARVSGEVDRAEQLEDRAQELLLAAGAVGRKYEDVRATQPSGWDRTSRLEEVLQEARALDTSGLTAAQVAQTFDVGSEGNRITALALIQKNPALASVNVLRRGILESRSAFEQYHALVAAESSLDRLTAADLGIVASAIDEALAGRLGQKSSDRRTVARRIKERLASR